MFLTLIGGDQIDIDPQNVKSVDMRQTSPGNTRSDWCVCVTVSTGLRSSIEYPVSRHAHESTAKEHRDSLKKRISELIANDWIEISDK